MDETAENGWKCWKWLKLLQGHLDPNKYLSHPQYTQKAWGWQKTIENGWKGGKYCKRLKLLKMAENAENGWKCWKWLKMLEGHPNPNQPLSHPQHTKGGLRVDWGWQKNINNGWNDGKYCMWLKLLKMAENAEYGWKHWKVILTPPLSSHPQTIHSPSWKYWKCLKCKKCLKLFKWMKLLKTAEIAENGWNCCKVIPTPTNPYPRPQHNQGGLRVA